MALAARARALLELRPRPRRRSIAVGVAAALLLAVVAMVVGRELIDTDAGSPPRRPAAPAADGFVRFRDEAGGLSIAYPAGWRRTAATDPEVRLVAEGDGASMLLRMSDLGVTVDAERLAAAKRLTDRLVRSAGQTQLQRPPRRVTLRGLPGYLYLYTYADSATGGRGAHAHYFLFRGQTLITIVFQTVPAQRFAEFAPLFDRIGETLEVTGL